MIFLLKRTDSVGYDEYDAKVVRAASEEEARKVADEKTGDEGRLWTDTERVVCTPVTDSGPSEEILGSFNAG